MNAGTAVAITRAWVAEQGPHIPDFCAAHLMGSLRTIYGDVQYSLAGPDY